MICDDEDLQPHIPQILFINKRQISQAEFDSLVGSWLPNVTAYRVDNPWMSCEKMKMVLKSLCDAVAMHSADRRIVLSSDCHRSHISLSTWQSASALNIFYYIIPAKMTWALQPCDTHLFAQFKHSLAINCQREDVRRRDNPWSITNLLQALNRTVDEIVNKRSWSKAFDDLGFRGHQRALTKRTLVKLDFAQAPIVSADIPELRDLLACFPQRTNVPIGHLFSAVSRAHRLAQLRQEQGAVLPSGREEIASATRRTSGSPLPSRRCSTTSAAADDAALLGASASSSVPHHTATTLRLIRLGSCRRSNSLVTTEEHAIPPLPPPSHP